MRRLAAFATDRAGASAVEFGLISIPLLMFIFGTIEFGRLMWAREALQQTAIAGARCMGMVQTGCGTGGTYSATLAVNFVQAQASSWSLVLPASGITLNQSGSCGGVSGFSTVSLSYAFTSVVPALIPAFAGGSTLTAFACFPNHP